MTAAKLVFSWAVNSLYITHNDRSKLYSIGYTYGYSGTNGFVILDFGNINVLSSQYGAFLFGAGGFVSTTDVQSLTEGFLDGWWAGYWAPGGGATIAPSALITVGVGLNNCGQGGTSINPNNPCVPGGNNMPPAHGSAWAQMVSNVQDYITSMQYAANESVGAATDMEPAWNYASISTTWIMSYTNSLRLLVKLFDLGSCDGCSYARADGTLCTSCLTMTYVNTTITGTVTWSWGLSDVAYAAWNAPYDWPVPEIYRVDGTNARQWYGLSRYVYDTNGSPVQFSGSLTTAKRYGNSPGDGWEQLWGGLYDDPLTRLDDIPWSTDINFQ